MKKFMLFLISCLFISNVNALSIKNVSNADLKAGSTVTYNIDLGSVSNGELSYDTNIFETLSTSNFKTNVKQSINSNTFIVSDTKSFNITLKVKNDVKDGKYEPIILKSGNDKVEQEVIINKEVSEDFFANIKRDYPFISPLLIVLIVLALIVILYGAFNKEGSKKNAFITVGAIVAIICLPLEILILFSKENNEIVKDAKVVNYKIKYEDEEEDNKDDEEEKTEDKELDSEQVSVSDEQNDNYYPTYEENVNAPSSVLKPNPTTPSKEEEPTPVEVAINNVSYGAYYSNPGDKVRIELTIDNNQNANVAYVVINNTKYPVKKIANNKYELFLAPVKAGLNELTITDLILDNNLVVSSNMKITIEGLKAKPTISDFKINNQKEVPEVSFKVIDNDHAFIKGVIKITNDEGKVIYEKAIKVGENIIPIEFSDNSKYHVNINISYDLDSDYYNDITGDINEGNELEDKDFTFTRDYNFRAKNVNITNKVKEDEQVILTFENDYASYYDVKKVIIDGEEHEVTKKGNTYQVVLNKKDKGLNYVNFEKVILENDASFEVGQTLTYVYLKDEPTITKLETSINANKITSSFEINDADNTVTSIKAILIKEGNTLSTKELDKTVREVDFDVIDAGNYQVKIVVSYDLGDEVILEKNKESVETLNVPIKSEIVDISNEKYITNSSDFKVTIDVSDNTLEDVVSFTIAGKEVPATKLSDDKYEITLNSTSTYGINSFNIENINYSKEQIEVSDKKIEIYTLKNIPEISNIVIDTVNLNVKYEISHLESFVSGEIIIDNDDNKKISINKDNLTTSFEELSLSEFVEHNLKIVVNYDLDDDVNNSLYNDTISKEETFEIKNNYNLTLTNLHVYEVTIDTIMLTFESTNASNDKYVVDKVVLNGKTYEVDYDGNGNYRLNIPVSDVREADNREVLLTITEVILDDEHREEVDAKTTVFEDLPTASITKTEVQDSKNIKVSYTTDSKDLDVTYHARMVGEDNSLYEIKEIDVSSGEVTFTNPNDFKNQKYTIVITATFDAKDHIDYEDYIISNSYEITVPIYVTINSLDNETIYAEKDSSKDLKYSVVDNTDKQIVSVKFKDIEGEYPATMENDNLTVSVKVPNEDGEKTYQIASVKYQDETDYLDVNDNSVKVYVLKDVPSVSDFKFDDLNNKITFKFNNPDEASLKDAKVTITKDGEIKKVDLNDNNEITLDSSYSNGEYVVSLSGTYDLGDGKELPLNKLLEETINVITDYQLEFKLDSFTVKNNESVTINYTSTNASSHKISKITVNGVDYEVSGNSVVVPYDHSDGETPKTFKITKVTLDNTKELPLTEEISFETYLEAPIATISEITNTANNTISANYSITGKAENIVAKLMVKELNSEEYVILETKEVKELNGTVSFNKEDNIYNAGDYKIELFADYDLVDGLEHKEVNITKEEKTTNVPIVIKNVTSTVSSGNFSPSAHYPTKGATVTLTYKVEANTDVSFNKADITTYDKVTDLNSLPARNSETISGIVNGKIYKKAPSVPGVVAYKINAVYYNDDKYEISESLQNSSIQYIDVVKDEIDFKNVVYTDKYHDDKSVEIDFEIADNDNVLESCENNSCYVELRPIGSAKQPLGKNITNGEEGESTKTVPFKKGVRNKVVFKELDDMQLYMFVINAKYDIDSNLLNDLYGEMNHGVHSDRHHTFYFISKPVDIDISELKVLTTAGVETSSLKVNENYKLSFKAELLGDKKGTNAKVKNVSIDGIKYDVTETDGKYITNVIPSKFASTNVSERTIYINGVTLMLEDGTEEYIYIHKNLPSVKVNIVEDNPLSIFMLPTKIDFF